MVAATRQELGPYAICERIGVGGMASVDRAIERGLEGLERVVALKRLLPHLTCDEGTVRAFVREARLGLLLQHANIAHTYMFGRVGTVYFIAMEYVDGCSVHRILQHARVNGPPPVPIAVAIARQICDALEYAHTQRDLEGRPLNLVHRDLSPSNLLLSRSGHVKVIDFGIAQSVQSNTNTERIKGKLAYMAPEAIAGDPLDARSDLFSLGVVFYELLVARPLFPQHDDPTEERPTIPPPKNRRDDLPDELDAVVMRALETDPKQRWESAAQFRAALLAASPSVATPSEIAIWCEPAFGKQESAADAVEPPRQKGARAVVLDDVPDYTETKRLKSLDLAVVSVDRPGEKLRTSGLSAVILDDVPAYPTKNLRKGEGEDAVVVRKLPRGETIATHIVPPPSRPPPSVTPPPRAAATPSRPPPQESTPPPTTADLTPTPAVASPVESGTRRRAHTTSAPPIQPARKARIDLRIAIGAVSGAAIGITILVLTRDGTKRPDPPQPELAIRMEAVSTTGTVTFDVTPANARIVAGELPPHEGSPWTVELQPGRYNVAVTAPEHEDWSTTIVVTAGHPQLVRSALAAHKPPPAVASAILAIDSTPTNLEVVLDGERLANHTPIRMGVVPGSHEIVVRDADGGVVWQTTFVAKDNQSHRFTATKPRPPPPVEPPHDVASKGPPVDAATPETPHPTEASDAAFQPPPPPVDDRAPL